MMSRDSAKSDIGVRPSAAAFAAALTSALSSCSFSMKLKNCSSDVHVSFNTPVRTSRSSLSCLPSEQPASLALSRSTRALSEGVPTIKIMSKRPGRVTAMSNAVMRFVATKKTQRCLRRRSFSCVSMAVVSMRDSMERVPSDRSRQNSSISSKRITVRSSAMSFSKMYVMRPATCSSPAARRSAVSIVSRGQPRWRATASHTVDLAVPGGPYRIAENLALFSISTSWNGRPAGASASGSRMSRSKIRLSESESPSPLPPPLPTAASCTSESISESNRRVERSLTRVARNSERTVSAESLRSKQRADESAEYTCADDQHSGPAASVR
mmetsp:Transcript_31769/g.79298  ORF Transcript_31769/g.79298 Transcript_31769/m.79298 type:complete len:326 (-) Transcript_31769:1391-2368(-)